MNECQVALKSLFEYLDKELDKKNMEDFERHLELCRKCYDKYEFEKILREKLREKAGGEKPSPRLLKRIEGMLDKFEE